MKKLFAIVALVAACSFAATSNVMAQEEAEAATEQVDTAAVDTAAADTAAVEAPAPVVEEESESLHKVLKTKFIEGDAGFMSLVALALVLGLAFCIERAINTEAEIQGSYLEEHCSWITFFIASAPSLGFLGTVIGMVMAFDTIEKAGDISPTVVAGGMKVALITCSTTSSLAASKV